MQSPQLKLLHTILFAVAVFITAATPTHAADTPTIVRPRVFIGVHQSHHLWLPATKKWQNDTTTWMPSLKFQVKGPVLSGSQYSVEFSKPGGVAWFKFDLETPEVKDGEYETLVTPRLSSGEEEKKFSNGAGTFGFKIRLKNELNGTNQVVHSGQFKVGKVSRSMNTAVTKNRADFIVDHDWTLPIGYMFFPDVDRSPLTIALWFKGATNGASFAGYIFHNGKQIGSTKGQGSFSTTEHEVLTMQGEAKDPRWGLWRAEWYEVSDLPDDPEQPNKALFYMKQNPGDYEIKVLRDGKLARQAKFKVGAEGKIIAEGAGESNSLGTDRMVLPVKIVGAGDGTYGIAAWKTDAFYGNPLKGFVAP